MQYMHHRPSRRLSSFLILLIATAVFPLMSVADVIQGPVENRLDLDLAAGTPITIELGLEEIAVINPVGDPRFLNGIEIEVAIPADAREFPGSLALLVLRNIAESAASQGARRIEGDRVILQPFPSGSRFFTALPTSIEHEFRSSATLEVAQSITSSGEMPIAVSIQPVMKGISRRAAAARVRLTIRPVTRNQGGLVLRFQDIDGNAIEYDDERLIATELRLDGENLVLSDLPVLRRPGLHRVSFRGEMWKEQSFTVGIERGSITTASIRLEPAVAKLFLSAPEGTEVFINGRDVTGINDVVELLPGEHTLLFRIGDHTVTRRIRVEPSREYKVSLSLDILVNED
ncbi:MAG: hypothetical protein EA428_02180 [Spirochaetaceae bacterium]|nr:MAG: hypothetical protein EA428_02180 [Spirochaetaceae bacterium]